MPRHFGAKRLEIRVEKLTVIGNIISGGTSHAHEALPSHANNGCVSVHPD
jgi:hypothetical protein